jgi:hypothetical protein
MAKMTTSTGGTVTILMRDLKGRKVVTKAPLKNGWMAIPAGTTCTIDSTWQNKVSITGDRCDCCKVKVSISHVQLSDLILVEEGP